MSSVLSSIWKQPLGFCFVLNNTDRIRKDCTSPFSECGPQAYCPRVTGELAKMRILSPSPRWTDGLQEWTFYMCSPMICVFRKAQGVLL